MCRCAIAAPVDVDVMLVLLLLVLCARPSLMPCRGPQVAVARAAVRPNAVGRSRLTFCRVAPYRRAAPLSCGRLLTLLHAHACWVVAPARW